MKSDSPIFSLAACAFGEISKKQLPNPRSQRFTATFSPKSFIILALTFRSPVYFELMFHICEVGGFNFILLHMDIQLTMLNFS